MGQADQSNCEETKKTSKNWKSFRNVQDSAEMEQS